MEVLSFIEKAFALCCGIMAEMGNIFHMSYQKINVILFCYIEPALFCVAITALLYVLMRLPGRIAVGKVALWIMGIVIASVAILMIASLVKLLLHYEAAMQDFSLIYNGIESSSQIRETFNGAVDWLNKVATMFDTTYEAVNIWLYIVIMPAGILLSIVYLLRTLLKA